MVLRNDLVKYLNYEFDINHIPDICSNGVCIEGKETVTKVGLVADVTVNTLNEAVKENIDFIISHHALLWKPERVFTGLLSKRMNLLFSNNITLYIAHHPLDVHKKFSHSQLIAYEIGLYGCSHFFPIDKKNPKHFLGVTGYFRKPLKITDLQQLVSTKLGVTPIVYPYGKSEISTIAIVSGSGGSCIEDAVLENIDCLITGEIKEHQLLLAKDLGIVVIAIGHSASELIGMKKLSYTITKKFKIPSQVIAS